MNANDWANTVRMCWLWTWTAMTVHDPASAQCARESAAYYAMKLCEPSQRSAADAAEALTSPQWARVAGKSRIKNDGGAGRDGEKNPPSL